jgi:hypothetical protein
MNTQLLRYSTLPPIPCAQRHNFGRTGRTQPLQLTRDLRFYECFWGCDGFWFVERVSVNPPPQLNFLR